MNIREVTIERHRDGDDHRIVAYGRSYRPIAVLSFRRSRSESKTSRWAGLVETSLPLATGEPRDLYVEGPTARALAYSLLTIYAAQRATSAQTEAAA